MRVRERALRALVALHRVARRAFPAGFRQRYAEELTEAFRVWCDGGGRGGAPTVLMRGAGGLAETVLEGTRERWAARDGGGWRAGAGADLRSSVRGLVRSPAFSLSVVLVLALGIGASVAVYGLVQAVLLRGAPFGDARTLVVVRETFREQGGPLEDRAVAYPTYREWRAGATAFEDLAIRNGESLPLIVEGTAPIVLGAVFTEPANFRILGVGVRAGRWFDDGEESASARVAVLSEAVWRTRFGSDPDVVGSTIRLGDVTVTVVGIAEAGFRGLFGGTDVWLPFRTATAFDAGVAESFERHGYRGYFVVGRLREGATLADAERQIAQVSASLQRSGVLPETRAARIARFDEEYFADVQRDAALLLGAVAVLLVIACTNVANLMLARQLARRQEMALRRALGARGGAIARPVLIESGLLALAGGLLGFVASPWLVRWLASASAAGLPEYMVPATDWTTAGFALFVSACTALMFGTAPALVGRRTALLEAMRAGARGAAAHGGGRGRRLLVMTQVGLAVPLLCAAGLTLRSMAEQLAIDPGFRAEGVVTASVALPDARYGREDLAPFADRLGESIARLPGVTDAVIASDVPIQSGYAAFDVRVPGPGGVEHEHRVYVHSVSPGYFELLGMRLVAGRTFDSRDRAGGREVVILTEAAARRFWPGGDAVGRVIEGAEVVGVVADASFRTLLPDPVGNPDDPDIFQPFAQRPARSVSVLLRTRDATAPVEAIREAVRRLDPALPVMSSSLLSDVVAGEVAGSRALARQLTLFALVALVLSAAGLYGVMAYGVQQRAPEIGVRMALGASRGRVLRQMLGQGATIVGTGMVFGLVVALGAGALLRNRIYGVGTLDPVTYAVVALVLGLAGLLACGLPALRATRVDPAAVLKDG